MCLSPNRRTRWPRPRPNTDWKMRFRDGMRFLPRPSGCRLTDGSSCLLKILNMQILHSLLPSHRFCISIHLSQSSNHVTIFSFCVNVQPSISSSSVLQSLSLIFCIASPLHTTNFRPVIVRARFRIRIKQLHAIIVRKSVLFWVVRGFYKVSFLLKNLKTKVLKPPDVRLSFFCFLCCFFSIVWNDVIWKQVVLFETESDLFQSR